MSRILGTVGNFADELSVQHAVLAVGSSDVEDNQSSL